MTEIRRQNPKNRGHLDLKGATAHLAYVHARMKRFHNFHCKNINTKSMFAIEEIENQMHHFSKLKKLSSGLHLYKYEL